MANGHPKKGGHPNWLPGQSGNPGGRPRTKLITAEIRAALVSVEVAGRPLPEQKTLLQVIMGKLVEAVLSPDLRISLDAIKLILDRTEGRVPERLEVTGEDNPHVLALRELLATVAASSNGNGKAKRHRKVEGDGDGEASA
jgi:hypothetical protein